MWLVFLDESGFTIGDWKGGMKQQPFYVVSAVCFPMEKIRSMYDGIRGEVANLGLADHPAPLGQGFEIKAKEIATGSGWWKDHKHQRNAVREAMLSAPKKYGGTAVVVAINKVAHAKQYAFPADPFLLGFQFAFERIGNFLESVDGNAYCIYDQNTRLQEALFVQSSELIKDGSSISGYSGFYEQDFQFVLNLERIVELGLGDSRHSLGLQIADYFATFSYRHFCAGEPKDIDWWDTLKSGLRRVNGKVMGYGLKVFP